MAQVDRAGPGIITVEQAAALLMKSKERVRQLAAAGFIPKAGRDRYPLVGTVQGYIRFRDESDQKKTQSAAESGLKGARQAEIEMRIAERRRDLVKRTDAELAMDVVVAQINQQFGGFAARVTRDPVLRQIIETNLDEALNAVADRLDSAKVSLANGEDCARPRRAGASPARPRTASPAPLRRQR